MPSHLQQGRNADYIDTNLSAARLEASNGSPPNMYHMGCVASSKFIGHVCVRVYERETEITEWQPLSP